MSEKDNSKGEGLKPESQALMDVQHALREAQFALQTMIEWAEKGDIPNAIALNMKRGKLIEIDRAFLKSYNLKPHPESPLVGTDKRSLASFISTFKSKRGEHFAGYQSLVDELSEAICEAYQEGKLNAKP